MAPAFYKSLEKALLAGKWQGNVRELDTVLQRALLLQSSESIKAQDLALESMAMTFKNSQNTDSNQSSDSRLKDDLRSHEQRHILAALEKNNGGRCATAIELGISERTLRYKLTRFREDGVAIPEKVGKKSA